MTLPPSAQTWLVSCAIAFLVCSPGVAVIMVGRAIAGILHAVKLRIEKGTK